MCVILVVGHSDGVSYGAGQVCNTAMTGFAMRIIRCDGWRKLSRSRPQCINAVTGRIHRAEWVESIP